MSIQLLVARRATLSPPLMGEGLSAQNPAAGLFCLFQTRCASWRDAAVRWFGYDQGFTMAAEIARV